MYSYVQILPSLLQTFQFLGAGNNSSQAQGEEEDEGEGGERSSDSSEGEEGAWGIGRAALVDLENVWDEQETGEEEGEEGESQTQEREGEAHNADQEEEEADEDFDPEEEDVLDLDGMARCARCGDVSVEIFQQQAVVC